MSNPDYQLQWLVFAFTLYERFFQFLIDSNVNRLDFKPGRTFNKQHKFNRNILLPEKIFVFRASRNDYWTNGQNDNNDDNDK